MYFESYAFANIFPKDFSAWDNYVYVGTISWKFSEKVGMKPNIIPKIMSSINSLEVDVIGFLYSRFNGSLVSITNVHHPKFSQIWILLMESFGDRFTTEQVKECCLEIFFANYWIGKVKLVKQLSIFHKEVQDRMDFLPSIQQDLWSDAKYISCGSNMKQTPLQDIFNRSYYTYHPFILERISPFYFAALNASIVNAKTIINKYNLE